MKRVPLFASSIFTGDASMSFVRTSDPDFLNKDQLGGIQFLWDAEFRTAYGGVSPIPNGAPFGNMAKDRSFPGHAAAATMVVASGQTVAFNNGIDFSTATTSGSFLRLPDEFSQAVYSTPNRYHSLAMLMTFPLETQWNPGTGQAPFYSHTTSNTGDNGGLGFISGIMRTFGGAKELRVNRQLTWNGSSGTIDNLPIQIPNGSPAFGGAVLFRNHRVSTGQKVEVIYANLLTFTASVSGRVMTVTTPPSGASLTIGTLVRGDGVPAETYISKLGTGNGGAGSYILNRAVSTPITGGTLRMPVTGAITGTAAVGAMSTAPFFSTTPMFGLINNQWSSLLAAGAGAFKLHRIWTDVPEISGLNPDLLALSDWNTLLQRNAF